MRVDCERCLVLCDRFLIVAALNETEAQGVVGLNEIRIDQQSLLEVLGGPAQIAGLECFLGTLEFLDGFGRNVELADWNKVVSAWRDGCRCTWSSRFETQAKVFPRVGHG